VIAVDTNILVRYLVQDDLAQGTIATHFLENELTSDQPGFVTFVAVLELDWVLRSQYGFLPRVVADTIRVLMSSPQLAFESRAAVETALLFEHGDLADNILHEIGQTNGCTKTVTFDKKFARLTGVELLTA
jgi:predicted nucleic-acid-binding protein